MATNKVRIGFVGVGGMGQCAHLKNYAAIEDCEVVAISEPRPQLAQRVAAKYGVAKVYASGAEMLAREKLDGIVASQPFFQHGALIPPLYQAGVPVFTEKPLAETVASAEKILVALKASGTWHMVGYHKRSDPATMCAKAEIDRLKESGEIGKLRYVRVMMPAGDWIAGGFNDLLKSNEPVLAASGEVAESWDSPRFRNSVHFQFVNYYIHQVNLLRHLFGEAYRVTYADKAGVLLVAVSASGVTGTIELSPYTTKLGWQESALVAFERGYVKLELPAPLVINQPGRVGIYTGKGTTTPDLPPVHAMRQQAINFCRAIRGEIKPLCDATEALEDLKVADDYIRMWTGQ
jgi:predicted dehydrogenase